MTHISAPEKNEFSPNISTLRRIMTVLLYAKHADMAMLVKGTGIHYTRVPMHINWLEHCKLIESIIIEHDVYFELTEKGKSFGLMILSLFD